MSNPTSQSSPGRYFWPLAMVVIFFLAIAASLTSVWRSGAKVRTYQARGIVREVDLVQRTATIEHEAVPGFMPAMTMPFVVTDVRELAAITNGDTVSFRITVTANDGWIDHLRKRLPSPATRMLANTSQLANAVGDLASPAALLKVGDLLPDYGFTNELGQPVRLADFRGQALALTFLFTRCPFPAFCPRLAQLFKETQTALSQNPAAPTNVHLLAVSLDPTNDAPAVLHAYAVAHDYDPHRWSFLTGQWTNTTALANAFGLKVWLADGTLNHNLRTVVVDARGKVQTVFIGNNWTAPELAAKLISAAQPTTP